MEYKAINLRQKFGLFTEHWQPKVVAEMNDCQLKIVKLQVRDGAVHVSEGDMFVSRSVEHKPYAESEVKLLLIEPRGVLNTGHEDGQRTASNDVWI